MNGRPVMLNVKGLNKDQINESIKQRLIQIEGIKYVFYLLGYSFDNLKDIIIPNNVVDFYIENSKLRTLSGLLLPPTLERFYCDGNQIISLSGFVFPESLEYFNANSNNIKNIDSIVFPDKLKYLFIEGNPIQSVTGMNFPGSLVSLRLGPFYIPAILINPKFNSIVDTTSEIRITKDALTTNYYDHDQLIFLYLNLKTNHYNLYQKILTLI